MIYVRGHMSHNIIVWYSWVLSLDMYNRYKNNDAMYFAPLIYTGFPDLSLVISEVKLLGLMHPFIPNMDNMQFHENTHASRHWNFDEETEPLHWQFPVLNTTTKFYNTLTIQFLQHQAAILGCQSCSSFMSK
jgi:hypothetical protein